VEDNFVRALHQQHIGYANCTTRALLEHMCTSYGRVHADNLVANTKLMQSSWDPNTPFESLAKQIEDQPFSAAQILTQAYSLAFSTGQYVL
jgi:hypothetical protein